MMRTVVVGNRALAKYALEHLLRNNWNIVGVVSASGSAARRQAGYVPFDDLVKDSDIKLIKTSDINTEEIHADLSRLEPDLCICPGWHQIIDDSILKIPNRGFVGLHSSNLPDGRGGAPVNWSLINGKSQIALSLFHYSDGVDDGDIIDKKRINVENRDDVNTILHKLALTACDILSAAREDFRRNTIETTPQSVAEATYRPRRQPQDGIINWESTTTELINWIRAQTDPYPGAYTFLNGDRVIIWSAEPHDDTNNFDPGTIHNICESEGISVTTGDGMIILRRVQKEGYPRMWADNFASRYNISSTDTFGRHHAPATWRYTGIRNGSGGMDFSSSTNLKVGETGTIQVIIDSRVNSTTTRIHVTLDSRNIYENKINCTGRTATTVEYTPESTGTHTLSIEFFDEKERIDRRYLKLFVD
jgi:methionyl-tRNA formyltransferase